VSATAEIAEVHRDLADGTIFIREWPVTDPEIVLVIAHGGGEHSGYWTRTARWANETLVATVAGLDFPGHGRSSGERLEVDDLDEWVDALALLIEDQRAQHPRLPVVLLGHSMGGLTSARYAQRADRAIDALVLHAAAAIPVEHLSLEPVEMTLEEMTADPELQHVIETDPYRVAAPLPKSAKRAIERATAQAMDATPLGSLPVIWLHGHDDRMVPIAGARAAFGRLGADRGALLTYPGIGHGGILENRSAQMRADLAQALTLLLDA